jgi:hypothetical protein
MDITIEKSRQAARTTFTYQYFHYFVTVPAQYFLQRNGLSKMSSPLTLYYK